MTLIFSRKGQIICREHGVDDCELDINDPFAPLDVLRADVQLEEGLTVVELMRALKPWSLLVSRLACTDFDAWLSAMELSPNESIANEENIIKVDVSPSVHVWREKKTASAELRIYWSASGVDKDGGHWGLDYLDPVLLGSLPVSVRDNAAIQDTAHGIYSWAKTPVLNVPANVGATLYDAIIRGFLLDVFDTDGPEGAAERFAIIKKAVQEIEGERDR